MEDRTSVDAVHRALAAHLCRCTGWRTIVDTVLSFGSRPMPRHVTDSSGERARLEGGRAQAVGAHVALGRAGFADDMAPAGALVAVRGGDGEWHVGETLTEARTLAAKVQGRRSTAALTWPVEVPPGDWDRTLQTTWVEPGYLEPDASWCEPGGEPVTPLANGGAFGGKATSEVTAVARRLADRHGRPVRVLYSREDVVRLGTEAPTRRCRRACRWHRVDQGRPDGRDRRGDRHHLAGADGGGGRRRRPADRRRCASGRVGRGRRAARRR